MSQDKSSTRITWFLGNGAVIHRAAEHLLALGWITATEGATPAAQVRKTPSWGVHPPVSVAATTNVTGVRESALQSVLFNAETEPRTSARKQRSGQPRLWCAQGCSRRMVTRIKKERKCWLARAALDFGGVVFFFFRWVMTALCYLIAKAGSAMATGLREGRRGKVA